MPNQSPIAPSRARVDGSGHLDGAIDHMTRRIEDLEGVFADEPARRDLPTDTVVYRVESLQTVAAGTPGGLFFGTSFVQAGKVGDEYFMTRGHFHANRDASEMYWGIAGTGCLVMRAEDGEICVEAIEPGSVHYVPGRVAHRVVNTGGVELSVGACWPADAGHDYAALDRDGFGVRVVDDEGTPKLVIGHRHDND